MPTTYPTRTTSADRGSFMTAADPVVVAGPRSVSSGESVRHDLHRGRETRDAAGSPPGCGRLLRPGHPGPRPPPHLVALLAQQVQLAGREGAQAVRVQEREPLRDLVRHGRRAASLVIRHSVRLYRHAACKDGGVTRLPRPATAATVRCPSMDTRVERRRPDRHLIALRLMRRIAIFALVASAVLWVVPRVLTELGVMGPRPEQCIETADRALTVARSYGGSSLPVFQKAEHRRDPAPGRGPNRQPPQTPPLPGEPNT